MTALVRAALLASALCPGAGAAAQGFPPPGATACSGCHGVPRGNGEPGAIPALHERSAAEIVAMVRAFRADERPATVMNRIAKGFADDEVVAIAAWLGARR